MSSQAQPQHPPTQPEITEDQQPKTQSPNPQPTPSSPPKSQSQPSPKKQSAPPSHTQLTPQNVQKMLEEHKQKMMPLVRFLKKNGLKFKTAGCNGIKVEYFRTDMLAEVLEKKKAEIAADSKLESLVSNLKQDLVYLKRPENSQKLRFPQFLTPSPTSSGKFATFKFDTSDSKKIYFIIVLFLILAAVLFPLWPYQLKYAMWILSVSVLVFMVCILILRLILYTIMASFGVSFWLLPNLLGDYGIIESFKPLFSIEKWGDNGVFAIVLRVLAFSIFVYYCHSVYTEPEFYKQNFESAKDIVKDVHDWGVNKITGESGNFSQRALTMQKILNDTADAFNESSNQYTSFEQPQQQVQQQAQASAQQQGEADGNVEPQHGVEREVEADVDKDEKLQQNQEQA